MMKKIKDKTHGITPTNLIILGNGFDLWQGLDTSYNSFRKYYEEHIDEILKSLRLKKHMVKEPLGRKYKCTDVEMIYGNPFNPCSLDEKFWHSFELSLDEIDSERVNFYYGKKKRQLYKMQTALENAQAILRRAFSDWIQSIQIDERDSGYLFGEDCYCINFNYTDTLAKRFGNPDTCFIHGCAGDGEDIVFGHVSHPQRATQELVQFGGRFLGLYLVEEMLYETDKHTFENLQFMRIDMANRVRLDQIKDIYVLGHSFSQVDYEYFEFLHREISECGKDENWKMLEKASLEKFLMRENPSLPPEFRDDLEDMHLRIQYAIHRYGERSYVPKEEAAAVERRLAFEHWYDEQEILGDFYDLCPELLREGHPTSDARWHISYYSEEDRAQIESVMKKLGCTNYELYQSIDECIEPFRVTHSDA